MGNLSPLFFALHSRSCRLEASAYFLEDWKLLSVTNMQTQKISGKGQMVFHSTVNPTLHLYSMCTRFFLCPSMCVCVVACYQWMLGCISHTEKVNSSHFVTFLVTKRLQGYWNPLKITAMTTWCASGKQLVKWLLWYKAYINSNSAPWNIIIVPQHWTSLDCLKSMTMMNKNTKQGVS